MSFKLVKIKVDEVFRANRRGTLCIGVHAVCCSLVLWYHHILLLAFFSLKFHLSVIIQHSFLEVPKLEMAFPSDINGPQLRSNCSSTVMKSAGGPLLAWQSVACKLFTTQERKEHQNESVEDWRWKIHVKGKRCNESKGSWLTKDNFFSLQMTCFYWWKFWKQMYVTIEVPTEHELIKFGQATHS